MNSISNIENPKFNRCCLYKSCSICGKEKIQKLKLQIILYLINWIWKVINEDNKVENKSEIITSNTYNLRKRTNKSNIIKSFPPSNIPKKKKSKKISVERL